ncbi:MAG: TonB-dependent receptor [Paraprevotella sp.]|nr:TonB-dependent receptor [Paraprevotella sp.]
MRGFLFSAAFITLIPFSAAAVEGEAAIKAGKSVHSSTSYIIAPASGQEKAPANPEERKERLDSTVVVASRAGKSTPVTYTMVGKKQLGSGSPLNSLPMTLNLQPSVVAVNEGGTGIGYSKMTIRGSKGAQVNVTLNGITVNDAESQEAFWVNMPSISNILSSVQLQRGLGTSANGSGAFGASVNMSTASVVADPYASLDLAAGSYSTFMATAAAGTGLTRSGIYFDAAYSRNCTDGYIRNAKAKVQSAYAALGWLRGNNSLKLTYIMGEQHTGITWNGIDLETYRTDRRYNSAGEWYEYRKNPDGSYVLDADGNRIVTSVHYYDNDTDNYIQHHLQLNYTHQFSHSIVWSTTVHMTKGDGYYENYKAEKKFTKYGFPKDFTFESDGVTYGASDRSDFIIRKSMDNYYLVLNSDVRYTGRNISVTGGVNLSRYSGDHFGEVLWNQILGDGYDYAARNHDDATNAWYFNNGLKQEINVFARAEYTPVAWITAYLDLQYRGVFLRMSGVDDEDNLPLDYYREWHFFNPRAGLTFHWNPRHKAYVSAAMGNREPARSDIKEVISGNNLGSNLPDLKPEKMADVEIGYEYTASRVTASANLYFMEYYDMLLETGRLNDVGYAIKENVGRGYRRGLELAVGWEALPWLRTDANATLSLNKIAGHTEYISNVDEYWDPTGETTPYVYGRTDMLMSPSVVAMLQFGFTPFKNIAHNSLKTTTLTLNGKYVGKQYLDNTSTDSRSIPGYFVANLSLTHEFSLRHGKLGIGGHINNLFNNMYYADGWCWKNILQDDGKLYDGIGIFPQAPINFMFKLTYRF